MRTHNPLSIFLLRFDGLARVDMDVDTKRSLHRDVQSTLVQNVQIRKWLGLPFFWLLFFGCSKKSNQKKGEIGSYLHR